MNVSKHRMRSKDILYIKNLHNKKLLK